MNDMDLIRGLRPGVPLPDAGELAPARSQLSAAIATEISAASAHGAQPRRSSWRPRRLALASVAATAVAAGVAAALIVVPGHGGPSGTSPATASGQAKPAIHPFIGHLTAARFLHAAAHAALQQPAEAPRPDQWIYSETENPHGEKIRTWLPADGSKNGIVLPSNAGGAAPACTVAQAQSTHCLPDAGYYPDMPTNPKLLFAYLDKVQIAVDTAAPDMPTAWLANDLGKAVFFLMQQTYLRPAQRAALFELVARTPDFTVVRNVRDAIGRVGVGVEWTYEGGKGAVIFDPGTYAYLGVRTWPVPSFHGPGAKQYDGDALIKLAVVNSPPPSALAEVPHKA
jgi:hypothetical protein